jgi:DNA-binding Lrp family transcriptional regulator
MPTTGPLTNHAKVLLTVANDPDVRIRDLAAAVGVTERSAHRILADLVQDGYVSRERVGNRSRYKVDPDHAFGESGGPYEGLSIKDFFPALAGADPKRGSRKQRARR